MEDVAREAGCTRRTFYAYFDGWEDLCVQVLLEDLNSRWEVQRQAVLEAADGVSALRTWAETYWDFARQHPESLHLQSFIDYHSISLDQVGSEARTSYRATVDPVVETLQAVFYRGQEDGSIRADLDRDECLGQFAYSLRAVMNRVLFPGESFASFDPDRFVASFIDLFMRSIITSEEV
jgi:AcrR family transcriptional regulator